MRLPFRITSDPVLTETEDPHQTPGEEQKLRFPVVVNGKISEGGELDFYGFDAEKGQELTFEVISHLGIEPTLTLYETDRELVRSESCPGVGLPPGDA